MNHYTSSVTVIGFEKQVTYMGVETIIIDAGEGNDSITIDEALMMPVTISGGNGNDTIKGGGGPAMITGDAGDDVIVVQSSTTTVFGNAGNDSLTSTIGDDVVLNGGADNDTLTGGEGTNTLLSGAGLDSLLAGSGDQLLDGTLAMVVTITGGSGLDTLLGSAGNDSITGGLGDQSIVGGDGADCIQGGSGRDTIIAGLGNDSINGGGANDDINGGAGDNLINGENGNDKIVAGDGNNTVLGGKGSDDITVGNGNNTIYGALDATGLETDSFHIIHTGNGNNLIVGDLGDDSIFSGSGQDTIHSRDGNDSIVAGAGNDRIDTGLGNHTIVGGAGADLILAFATTDGSGPATFTNIVFGDNDNSGAVVADTSANADTIFGGPGNETIRGGAGPDVIRVFDGQNEVFGELGDDSIVTGLGNDIIDGSFGSDTITAGSGQNTIIGGWGRDLIYAGISATTLGDETTQNLIYGDVNDGSSLPGAADAEADTIFADNGPDLIFAGFGSDRITANGGNDTVEGEQGNDTIDGDAGDDSITGADGSDVVRAGSGTDIVWGGAAYFSLTIGDAAQFQAPPLAEQYLNDSERLAVALPLIVPVATLGLSIDGPLDSDGSDLIYGDDGTDYVFAGSGNDTIDGGAGSDYLDGGFANDIVLGGDGNDVARGGRGDDVVFMSFGWDASNRNTIAGGAGLDQIYGDEGDDTLWGGAGVAVKSGMTTTISQAGSRMFAGDGNDFLYAYADVSLSAGNAAVTAETLLKGIEMHAGAGQDWLYGNLRREVMFGDGGNDNLFGDFNAGPTFALNTQAALTGGDDVMYGGDGEDRIFGGGGRDLMFGGASSDFLEGQNGTDTLYGGERVDVLVLDTADTYTEFNDVFDGHYGNQTQGDFADDNATDIMMIRSTAANDVIRVSQSTTQSRDMLVTYNGRAISATWRDTNGKPLVEQFNVQGGEGNDLIQFAQPGNAQGLLPLDLSALTARSRDFVTVIQGGPGNDTLIGSSARDRIDGSAGNDQMFGLGGDDRLFGDQARNGDTLQTDSLYGGAGDDDLIGGIGRNVLSAWSYDPLAAGADGPAATSLHFTNGQTATPNILGVATVVGTADLPANGVLVGANGITGAYFDPIRGVAVPASAQLGLTIGGLTPYDIVIPSDPTNASEADPIAALISDINTVLQAAGLSSQLVAGRSGNKLFIATRPGINQSLTVSTGRFGVFADAAGGVHSHDGAGTFTLEDTGLNRSLGSDQNDLLYGGTGLDFLYDQGGQDTLFKQDGTKFESLDGGLAGDAWKDYARQSNKVWYVGGSNADDVINVDYVTEPGLLQDHHLITRLTNNGGNFSFAAQVRLDFGATGEDGALIWDASDVILNLDSIQQEQPAQRQAKFDELVLSGGLLPSEGDFQVIIVDALGGNDVVNVGPTVQKTVWVDGGEGDDRAVVSSGNAILTDKTEQASRNDSAARASALTDSRSSNGFIGGNVRYTGLTIDSPSDMDWYSFTLGTTPANGATLRLTSAVASDNLQLTLYRADDLNNPLGSLTPITTGADRPDNGAANNSQATAFDIDNFANLGRIAGLSLHTTTDEDWFKVSLGSSTQSGDAIRIKNLDASGPALRLRLLDANGNVLRAVSANRGATASIGASGLPGGDYFVQIKAESAAASHYELLPTFNGGGSGILDLGGAGQGEVSLTGVPTNVPLAVRVTSPNLVPTIYSLAVTLDPNNASELTVNEAQRTDTTSRRDVLIGGTGSDTLQGGPGDPFLFGNDGNDLLTAGPKSTGAGLLFGGNGDDTFQIMPHDLPTTNEGQTYFPEVSTLIDGGAGRDRMLYQGGDFDAQGRAVPDNVAIKFNTILRRYEVGSLVWDTANQEFVTQDDGRFAQRYDFYQPFAVEFTEINTGAGDDIIHADAAGYQYPGDRETWGFVSGTLQQGATIAALKIDAGDGNDQVFGGQYDDTINGGEGLDFIQGGGGDDVINGGAGNDLLAGNNVPSPDAIEIVTRGDTSSVNDTHPFASALPDYVADMKTTVISTTGSLSQPLSGGDGRYIVEGLSLSEGDRGDWLLLKTPDAVKQWAAGTNAGWLTRDMLSVQFLNADGSANVLSNSIWAKHPTGQAVIHANNAPATNGRLTTTARFAVRLDGGQSFEVVVDVLDTATNNSVADLADNINRSIRRTALGDQVVAGMNAQGWLQLATAASGSEHSLEITQVDMAGRDQLHFAVTPRTYGGKANLNLFAASNVAGNGQAPQFVPVERFAGVPDYYLIHVVNVRGQEPGQTPDAPHALGAYQLVVSDKANQTLHLPATADDYAIHSSDPADTPALIPLGDINGDGIGDFVSFVQDQVGSAEDFLNLNPSLNLHPASVIPQSVARITFGSAGTSDVTVTGSNSFKLRLPAPLLSESLFGSRSTIVHGDFNGDGIQDLAIGVSLTSNNYGRAGLFSSQFDQGGVHLLFGRANWASELDAVADADVSIKGTSGGSSYTPFTTSVSVANAGHFNNDAIDDLIVGDVGVNHAYVYYGRPTLAWAGYKYDFENNGAASLEGFTIDNNAGAGSGLWHVSTGRSSDRNHTKTHSLYFGTDETAAGGGNFSTGSRVAGSVTSSAINLAGVPNPTLLFNSFLKTENIHGPVGYDIATVRVSTDPNFATSTLIASNQNFTLFNSDFSEAHFSLDSFANQTIYVRFEFDSIDAFLNDYEGWYVDDVRVGPGAVPADADFRGQTLAPDFAHEDFGAAVAGVGDVTGDGVDDIAIVAQPPLTRDNAPARIYVIPGNHASPYSGTQEITAVSGLSILTDVNRLSDIQVRRAGNIDGDVSAGSTPLSDLIITGRETSAVPGVFGTAFDEEGAELEVGRVDAHWRLISGPNGVPNSQSLVVSNPPPITVELFGGGTQTFSGFANSATGKWLQPAGTPTGTAGIYRFQTQFDLTGFDISTAEITANITGATKIRGVYINGERLPSEKATSDYFGIQTLPIKIDSGFNASLNTLAIEVESVPVGGASEMPIGILLDSLKVRAAKLDSASYRNFLGFGGSLTTGNIASRTGIVDVPNVGGALVGLGDINNDGRSDLGAATFRATQTLNESGDVIFHQVATAYLGETTRTSATYAQADLLLEPARPIFGDPRQSKPQELNFASTTAGGTTRLLLAEPQGGEIHAFVGRALAVTPAASSSNEVASLPVRPYELSLATAIVPGSLSTELAGVNLLGPQPQIRDAFSVEGVTAQDALSSGRSVGDINGDGFTDILVSGLNRSYVFFGPLTLDDADAVGARSELHLTSALGQPSFGSGNVFDVDPNEPKSDIAFIRHDDNSGQTVVTLVLGREFFPRDFDGSDLNALNSRTIELDDTELNPNGKLSTHILDWTGDGLSDVLVTSSLPTSSGKYGYVFSGARLRDGSTVSNPVGGTKLVAADARNTISIGSESALGVAQELLGDLSPQVTVSGDVTLNISVAGDINGDGQTDLLFAQPNRATLSVGTIPAIGRSYLVRGRDSLGDIVLGNAGQVVQTGFGLGDTLVGLGDLNRDGYDDYAITRSFENGSNAQGSVFAYKGSADVFTNVFANGTPRTPETRAIGTLSRAQAADFGSTLRIFGSVNVTSGDFDGDGTADLAVGTPHDILRNSTGQTLDDQSQGRVQIFFNALGDFDAQATAGNGRRLYMNAADVALDGQFEFDRLGSITQAAFLDTNNDRISDLLIGAGGADGVIGGTTLGAGRVYSICGAAKRYALPTTGVSIISNQATNDGVDVLVNLATGQPEVRGGVFGPNETEKWYRFTTLGDGQAGDQIQLLGVTNRTLNIPLYGQSVGATAGGLQSPNVFVRAGGTTDERGLFNFDFGSVYDGLVEPTKYSSAKLQLVPDGDLPTANVANLTPGLDRVFFTASTARHGNELWVSDGSQFTNSTRVFDIAPGAASSNPTNLTHATDQEAIYFTANFDDMKCDLMRVSIGSDSDSNGGFLVETIAQVPGNPREFRLTDDGQLIYFITDESNGASLWITDGTSAGTRAVLRGANVSNLVIGGANGDQPIFSGTLRGETHLLTSNGNFGDVTALTNTAAVGNDSAHPQNITRVGSLVYFSALTDRAGQTNREVWSTDGTVNGTALKADINQSSASAGSNPANFIAFNNTVYFTADDGSFGNELWRINNLGNAERASELNSGSGSSNLSQLSVVGTGSGNWLFSVGSNGEGQRLFANDSIFNYDFQIPGDVQSYSNTFFGRLLVASIVSGQSKLFSLDLFNFTVTELATLDAPVTSFGRSAEGTLINTNGAGFYVNGSFSTTVTKLARPSLRISVLAGETTGTLQASDYSAAVSNLPLAQQDVSLNSGGVYEVELKSIIDALWARGQTRFTLRVSEPATTSSVNLRVRELDGNNSSLTFTTTADGLTGDLYNADGARIASGQSLFDLRNAPAGTYYLRVDRTISTGTTLPFEVQISPPFIGESRLTDRVSHTDVIHGGDGDDLVIGQNPVDRLFGDSGADRFIGPDTSIRDRQASEAIGPPITELFNPTQANNSDPILFVPDQALKAALGRAIGRPVTKDFNGNDLVRGDIHASELASLTRLDLSDLGIANLRGLEYATNLQILNLSHNQVSNVTALQPGRDIFGNIVGMAQLRTLELDFNDVTNIQPLLDLQQLEVLTLDNNFNLANVGSLGALSKLKLLSIDRAHLGAASDNHSENLADLTQLKWLSLAENNIAQLDRNVTTRMNDLLYLDLHGNQLIDISGLVGQREIDDGDTGFTTVGTWQQNISQTAGAHQGDYRFTGPGDGSGTASWSFTDLAADLSYDIFLNWPAATGRSVQVPFKVFSGVTLLGAGMLNQATAPSGAIGRFTAANGALRVEISNQTSAGSISADSVRVVQAPEITPNLVELNLLGSSLDNFGYETAVPFLQSSGTTVFFTSDTKPTITSPSNFSVPTVPVVETGHARHFTGATSPQQALNLPNDLVHNNTTLTFEAWFRTTGSGTILGYQNAPVNENTPTEFVPAVYVGTDGKLRGLFFNGTSSPITTSGTVNDGQWHHVALTSTLFAENTAGFQRLLLDGQEVGTASGIINHLTMHWNQIGSGFGSSGWPATGGSNAVATPFSFTGDIEDVRFWNTVRTPQEIQNNRYTELTGNEPFLIGYYKLDEASGAVANDLTDLTGAGSYVGAAVPAVIDGLPAFNDGPQSGLLFDGIDDAVNVGSSPVLKVTTQLTLEANVLPLEYTGGVIAGREGEYQLSLLSGGFLNLELARPNGGNPIINSYLSSAQVSLGDWSHVAVVVDTVAGIAKFFVNGTLRSTVGINDYGAGPIDHADFGNNDFRIGNRGAFGQPFQGYIDEVRVWNTLRTDGQIFFNQTSRLLGTQPGLIGDWKFDESSGTTAFDSSPSGLNGTLQNGVTRGLGRQLISYSIPIDFDDADTGRQLQVSSTSDQLGISYSGQELHLSPTPGFSGVVDITLTASGLNSLGVNGYRSTTTRFAFDVGRNAIYGADADLPEGAVVFLDADNNGQLDSGETTTLVDANGEWRFRDLDADTFRPTLVTPSAFFANTPTQAIVFNNTGSSATSTLNATRVVVVNGSHSAIEGATVNLTSTIIDPNPGNGSNLTRLWNVVASNGQTVANGTGTSFSFVPSDNGLYTITLTVTDTDDSNRQYVDSFRIVVANATPTVDAGNNQMAAEGTNVTFTDPHIGNCAD